MNKLNLDLENIRELHQSGQLDAAKAGYLAFLRKNPREADVLHSLGILCAQQEDFAEAIEHLQSALKIQPNNLSIILHLANILKFQGLYNQAAQSLENAIHIDPNYTPAFNNLGTVYYAQGRLEDAVNCYTSAIEKNPDYIDARYNLGLALNKQNKFSEAITAYTELLKLAPEHFAAKFHLACLLMQVNKTEEAIKIFLDIEAAHPHHFETQTNLATSYLKTGALNEAKLHYFKALELTPNDTQIMFNLGIINMQQGHIDTAIQYYQRLLQINSDDVAAHTNLGAAFLAKQHVGFALRHFKDALRLQPDNKALNHTIDILSRHEHLVASPPEYIKSLFDSYADHYEPHLLKALDYRLPEYMERAILEVTKPPLQTWDILDLGCGTGLCGVRFKPYAKKLVGVDLSEKMLEIAAQKGIYDSLIADDLAHFLAENSTKYNLIIAGDVLVYMGELRDIFKKISSLLHEKGLFVFNTEIGEGVHYKMNQSGRFVHDKKYLEKLAGECGLKVVYYQAVTTRMQNNEPVQGHLFVLGLHKGT